MTAFAQRSDDRTGCVRPKPSGLCDRKCGRTDGIAGRAGRLVACTLLVACFGPASLAEPVGQAAGKAVASRCAQIERARLAAQKSSRAGDPGARTAGQATALKAPGGGTMAYVVSLNPTGFVVASPYNSYCPLSGPGHQRCMTGCVATALGQIINCWRCPSSVAFSERDSYRTDTLGISVNAPSACLAAIGGLGAMLICKCRRRRHASPNPHERS
jgi:hypothetical protein